MDMTALDKYLTSPPLDDDYQGWIDAVVDCFTDDFYEANEGWILSNGVIDKWLSKLFGTPPQRTAAIIERAFKLYRL